jgi:regulator of RNase E activity RraA
MPTGPDPLLDRLRRLDTTSLVDADVARGLRVLSAALRPVRPGSRLVGRAFTVDAREDLLGMLVALREATPGEVIVVGAGSDEHAVAGELFGTEAQRRGLAGIVIDGRCRDSRTLARLDLPVFARGVAPTAFPARAVPVVQVPVVVGGVEVRPGELVLGDDDGLVVGSDDAVAASVDGAEVVQRREEALRAAVEAGESLLDHVDLDAHLDAVRDGRESALQWR